MLNNTKARHFCAQIVSWAPRHARKTFIVLAQGANTFRLCTFPVEYPQLLTLMSAFRRAILHYSYNFYLNVSLPVHYHQSLNGCPSPLDWNEMCLCIVRFIRIGVQERFVSICRSATNHASIHWCQYYGHTLRLDTLWVHTLIPVVSTCA